MEKIFFAKVKKEPTISGKLFNYQCSIHTTKTLNVMVCYGFYAS